MYQQFAFEALYCTTQAPSTVPNRIITEPTWRGPVIDQDWRTIDCPAFDLKRKHSTMSAFISTRKGATDLCTYVAEATALVATVNSDPAMVVTCPKPLDASVNACPPAEETTVTRCPPSAVT